MKIAFFSNFLNHHQAPLCENLYRATDGQFRFVACAPIKSERIALGYRDMNLEHYVIRAYENEEQAAEAEKWCMESDVIIFGSADLKYIEMRMNAGLPVFRYAERFFKKGFIHALGMILLKEHYKMHRRYRNDRFFTLCSSAYTAQDLKVSGYPKNKCFKWGYFPKVTRYDDIDALISAKKKNSILWCGRLIDWKHPEAAVVVAEKLKNEGFEFNMSIVGNGDMEDKLKAMIKSKGLEQHVALLGSMSPEEVRAKMEESAIYLFTSDRGEGWGAVLNESMNSGCAVVASHASGSVPFLINDGQNGFIYRNGDTDGLFEKVKFLLNDRESAAKLGKAAYITMAEQWNAENAAERFLKLAEVVCEGDDLYGVFEDGVCSNV